MADQLQEPSGNRESDLTGNFALLINELGDETLAQSLVIAYAAADPEHRAEVVTAAIDERLAAIKLEHAPNAEA